MHSPFGEFRHTGELLRKSYWINPLPLVVGDFVDEGTDEVIMAILPKEPNPLDAKSREHPSHLSDGTS